MATPKSSEDLWYKESRKQLCFLFIQLSPSGWCHASKPTPNATQMPHPMPTPTSRDEGVEDDLGAIEEIAKLSLPEGQ